MTNKASRCCPEDKIEISAPVEKVWSVLSDFNRWQEWNPLYVESKGNLAVGEILHFSVALPGMKPHRGNATVVALEPNKSIQYQIVSGGGLIKGTRYIEIVEVEPGLCTVANGEVMGGLLAPVLFKFLGERIRQGLEGMNVALKSIVENS